MPDVGFVFAKGFTKDDVQDVFSLEPSAVLLEIPTPRDMIVAEKIMSVPNPGNVPIYPIFMGANEGLHNYILANMVQQSFELFGNDTVYLSLRISETLPHYLYGLQAALAEEFGITQYTAFLCESAYQFLNTNIDINPVPGVFIQPCVLISDTNESRMIWRDRRFLEFLYRYPATQFIAYSIEDGGYSYEDALAWERRVYFRSFGEFRKQKQRKAPRIPGVLATGTTIVDKATAWEDVDLRHPNRKLALGEVVSIVEFRQGRAGKVALTVEGDYISVTLLDVEE